MREVLHDVTVVVEVPAFPPNAGPSPAPVPTTTPPASGAPPLASTGTDLVTGVGLSLVLVAAGLQVVVTRRLGLRRAPGRT